MKMSQDTKEAISLLIFFGIMGVSLVGLVKLKEKYDSSRYKQKIEMIVKPTQKQK